MRNRIRVVVVDDHGVVRAGIGALLAREPDCAVVGSFGRAEDALRRMDELVPDVVVLDYRLGGMSGAVACREIRRRPNAPEVLMFAGDLGDEVLRACFAAGAAGFLPKDARREDLAQAVRTVARGEPFVPVELMSRIIGWAGRPRDETTDLLEPDEVLTLSLMANGGTNAEIARRLGIGQTALKQRSRVLMGKLGARGRSEAVALGIRRGVI